MIVDDAASDARSVDPLLKKYEVFGHFIERFWMSSCIYIAYGNRPDWPSFSYRIFALPYDYYEIRDLLKKRN